MVLIIWCWTTCVFHPFPIKHNLFGFRLLGGQTFPSEGWLLWLSRVPTCIQNHLFKLDLPASPLPRNGPRKALHGALQWEAHAPSNYTHKPMYGTTMWGRCENESNTVKQKKRPCLLMSYSIAHPEAISPPDTSSSPSPLDPDSWAQFHLHPNDNKFPTFSKFQSTQIAQQNHAIFTTHKPRQLVIFDFTSTPASASSIKLMTSLRSWFEQPTAHGDAMSLPWKCLCPGNSTSSVGFLNGPNQEVRPTNSKPWYLQ